MDMRALLSKFSERPGEFFLFIAVGILNTCFGYCVYALMIFMDYQLSTALLVTFGLGVGFNFLTFGKVAFKGFNWSRAPHFLAVYCINYLAIVWMISTVQHYINPSPYIAYLIVIPISVTFLYFSLRLFVFKNRA